METATGPFILRSMYKDEHLTQTNLVEPVTQLLISAFGAHVVNQYDAHIGPFMKGLYTFCSMLKGQTLGEEFCDILPVVSPSQWRSVGVTRKLVLSLLQCVEPSALYYAAHSLFPASPPHEILGNVHKIVLCLFFLFETYVTIPHRLTQIRYLSLHPSRLLPDSEGARKTYFILGLVTLIELIIRLWRYQRVLWLAKEKERMKLLRKQQTALRHQNVQGRKHEFVHHNRQTTPTPLPSPPISIIGNTQLLSTGNIGNRTNVNNHNNEGEENGYGGESGEDRQEEDEDYEDHNDDDDDDDDDDDNDENSVTNKRKTEINGKCMLCLSYRKCPTSTQCGHVFCWRCIASWIQSNPTEAICPLCRQHITAQSLVPLYFYVVNDVKPINVSNASNDTGNMQNIDVTETVTLEKNT